MFTDMPSYYDVPEQFVGKSLQDLRKERSDPFRADLVANILGVDQNSPFQAGQRFTLNDFNPQGAEGQFISSQFTQGVSPEQRTLRESSQQAINTLQSGSEPLKQRYNDVIASIKGTKEQEVQRADITSAQELARRGIPVSSTYASEYQQGRRLPVQTAFAGQEAQAGLSAEQAQQNIRNAVAAIQQATGRDEVNAILNQYQQAEQQRQFNENLALSQRQQSFAEQQAQQPQQVDQFTTLSEGQTLFDLLSGQPVYTNPKTYKPESGNGTFDEGSWA